MKKILLDTNAYSALRLKNTQILDELAAAETVYLSVIVLGELVAGFNWGKYEHENMKVLHRFLDKPTVKVLPVSFETSLFYSKLWHLLKKKGKPIPTNDLWIAAHALETGSTLITFDKHFSAIDAISLWEPGSR